jgi:hypothetical protein
MSRNSLKLVGTKQVGIVNKCQLLSLRVRIEQRRANKVIPVFYDNNDYFPKPKELE